MMIQFLSRALKVLASAMLAVPLLGASAAPASIQATTAQRPPVGSCDKIIHGSENDDVIKAFVGAPAKNCTIVFAYGGDDKIYGSFGVDYIFAGGGDDQVDAGNGDDVVWGGSGDDRLYGGWGADDLYGFGGRDAFNLNEPDNGDAPDHADGGTGVDCAWKEPGDVVANVEVLLATDCYLNGW